MTLRELERDVQASRAVYESFLVRARETGEQERLDTKNIRVISRAELPQRRSFPPSNFCCSPWARCCSGSAPDPASSSCGTHAAARCRAPPASASFAANW